MKNSQTWYYVLTTFFALTITAQDNSSTSYRSSQTTTLHSKKKALVSKNLKFTKQSSKNKRLQHSTLLSAIMIGIAVVVAALVYRKIKDNSTSNNDEESANGNNDSTTEGPEVIDKTVVPQPPEQLGKFWNVRYSIYQSTVIKKDSIIVTSNRVKRSFFSYKSSHDVFYNLNPSTTLFVNSANTDLSFSSSGANGYLAARIREKQDDKDEFDSLESIDKWGDITDPQGNEWEKDQLNIGEFIISHDEASSMSIAHIAAPALTLNGHDSLEKGIEELCYYAYSHEDYQSLILCAPGTVGFTNNKPDIGNSAYRAITKGIEKFLRKIAKDSNKQNLTIYCNFWDYRVVQNVPPL